MTALAGFLRFDLPSEIADRCARMLAAQAMFGPHGARVWSGESFALGRSLYRRVPEDDFDRGVAVSRDGRFVLAADVRLDNRDDLIGELRLSAESTRSMPDAAILLAALERWDEAALDRVVGDFAFALWEPQARRLRLARDFLGQYPLHFHRGRDFFAFASMPGGLHALPEIPYAPDEQRMAEFLGLLPAAGTATFFKSIERVEPGHVVTVVRDKVSSREYWQPKRYGGGKPRLEDSIEGLRFHLDQATRSRLRGAGACIGSTLSGGLDSSAVTATAARLLAPSGGQVAAFTYVPGEDYAQPVLRNRYTDETPLARETAALYPNIEHVLVRAGHLSPVESLDKQFLLFGMPFVGLAVMPPNDEIYRQARARRLSVMLLGSMGNMSLSYTGVELLPELLRKGRLLSLMQHARSIRARSGMRWTGVLAQTLGPFTPTPVWQALMQRFTGHKHDVLAYTPLRADALRTYGLEERARERHLDFTYRPWADGFDLRLWVLRRLDNATYSRGILAGWGIDRRDPTADRRLVEYCLSLPTEHFIPDGVPRGLARRALADRLPRAVVNELRRGYNSVDWHVGATAARADIAAELERIEACAPAARMLDIERLKRLLADWPTEGWERPEISAQYRTALLRGISAGHFLRKATGGNR